MNDFSKGLLQRNSGPLKEKNQLKKSLLLKNSFQWMLFKRRSLKGGFLNECKKKERRVIP